MSRELKPIIVGNWKMHKTIAEAKDFIKKLAPKIENNSANVWLAVPFTAIYTSCQESQNSKIVIGAQNMHDSEEGAFTGEVSCRMIKEAGASFVILGHSERRQLFHESSQWVNKKLKRAIHDGVRPVVCVGETLDHYQNGQSREVLNEQLETSLDGLSDIEIAEVIIAYEPVWAIGTNKTATPALAQEIHTFCREYIALKWNATVAEQVAILYGGSVKEDNAASLLAQSDIDGLLVGGSSLSVDAFSKIIHYT